MSLNYMTEFCNRTVTILNVKDRWYEIKEDYAANGWTDEMIDGLVEEETKFGTASNPIEIESNTNCLTQERVGELATKIDKELPTGNQDVWELPDGYQFTDENGTVINAQRIVLEKKKPKYPRTYEECCDILQLEHTFELNDLTIEEETLLKSFIQLKRCRDAYWKIAGEEMGLGKPWEFDCTKGYYTPAIIYRTSFIQKVEINYRNAILVFPTTEMRNAFYENFKTIIEECKELL